MDVADDRDMPLSANEGGEKEHSEAMVERDPIREEHRKEDHAGTRSSSPFSWVQGNEAADFRPEEQVRFVVLCATLDIGSISNRILLVGSISLSQYPHEFGRKVYFSK
jgi:hypothetical protein